MNDIKEISGIVTDFKRFAVHDGDGIRTTVFLKGCPLKCVWCHNPESLSPKPELALYVNKCIACGECVKVCENGVHKLNDGVHTLDRSRCIVCGKCEAVCPVSAIKICGKRMTVDEVIKIVAEDKIFYGGEGGMTLSGGEPTMQPEFALSLMKAAKESGINTALDTCGLAKRETYESMLPYVDTFLYDVKHITPEGHIRCTGCSNELILDNLHYLSDSGAQIEIRIPFVPGYNDDDSVIDGIGRLLSEINVTKLRLLPYHSYARTKYNSLDIPDTLPDVEPPDKNKLEHAARLLRTYVSRVIVD